MGKSIRSKVKRAWRSKMRVEVNGPVEKQSLENTIFRLQKRLLAQGTSGGATLAGLGAALGGREHSAPVPVVDRSPTIQSMDTSMDREEAAEALRKKHMELGETCGVKLPKEYKNPCHGVPRGEAKAPADLGHEKGYTFLKDGRVWEAETLPEGETLLTTAELADKVAKPFPKPAKPAAPVKKSAKRLKAESLWAKRKRERQQKRCPYWTDTRRKLEKTADPL